MKQKSMKSTQLKSYAQNAEDIILLQGFQKQKTGFYVDVGAASPVQHSVTKVFYDKGWHGINVEPIKEQFEMLSRQRPRDINIQAAVDIDEGSEKLYVFPTRPGLTTTDRSIAKTHIDNGMKVREETVIKTRLDKILDKYCDQPIDFLKIDVEGNELKVLESLDLKKWRPRVLIVEATKPRTTVPSHQEWEPRVLNAGYKMVQFDGLNRFYVRIHEKDLCKSLSRKATNYETVRVSKEYSELGK